LASLIIIFGILFRISSSVNIFIKEVILVPQHHRTWLRAGMTGACARCCGKGRHEGLYENLPVLGAIDGSF
jgi:hypothetical protein